MIKVVGVSGSGKSTLVAALRHAGYNARPVSQEHSSVANLWRHFGPTDVLIYLNVSLEGQRIRRPDVSWTVAARHEEVNRLRHAWDHADLRIDTTHLSPVSVQEVTFAYLSQANIRRAPGPLVDIPATGSPTRLT